jgi:hypothetical protein
MAAYGEFGLAAVTGADDLFDWKPIRSHLPSGLMQIRGGHLIPIVEGS